MGAPPSAFDTAMEGWKRALELNRETLRKWELSSNRWFVMSLVSLGIGWFSGFVLGWGIHQ